MCASRGRVVCSALVRRRVGWDGRDSWFIVKNDFERRREIKVHAFEP